MKSVDLLKKELKARVDTTEIIDVMKKAAVSQFKYLETLFKTSNHSNDYLDQFIAMLNIRNCFHPFLINIDAPTTIIIITSDEGFLGGLNSQVIRRAFELKEKKNAELVVLGERGAGYIEDLGEAFTQFPGFTEEVTYEEVVKLKNHFINEYVNSRTGKVIVVYPKFVSFSHQEAAVCQLIPCNYIFPDSEAKQNPSLGFEGVLEVEQRGIKDSDKTGNRKLLAKSEKKKQFKERRKSTVYDFEKYEDLLVEPDIYTAVDYICKSWIENKLFEIAKNSKLSEFAARSIHLEGSFQEFSRKNKEVKFKYQKSLHEAVDNSIREIFASMVLWKDE